LRSLAFSNPANGARHLRGRDGAKVDAEKPHQALQSRNAPSI
jgi:hypothetical protein